MKISPTTLTVNQLLSSANERYVIPPYQRRYSWYDSQVWDLLDDISLIESNGMHLLGSVVCLTKTHSAKINELELVDGQQRLTTIAILLECIRNRLHKLKDKDGENELGRLLAAQSLDQKSLPKLQLDTLDQDEYSQLAKGKDEGSFKNECLKNAFSICRAWVDRQNNKKLRSFLFNLKNKAIVVRLDVDNAKDAFKLFETINDRGLRLSPTDIVKNFLLGNAARFGSEYLKSAREMWAKLLVDLDGLSTDTFLRYYLTGRLCRRITASYVVEEFKKLFMTTVKEAEKLPDGHMYCEDSIDGHPKSEKQQDKKATKKVPFEVYIDHLAEYARIYAKLASAKTGNQKIDQHLDNLRQIDATQTYGFLTYLRMEGCKDKDFVSVLKLTENFLLRRHICLERGNENEGLFARLCGINAGKPLLLVKQEYRNLCPSDAKFQNAFQDSQFKSIPRARYCLERVEIAKHGEYEELKVLGPDLVHVEHIMPKKIKTKRAKKTYGDWIKYLGKDAMSLHQKYIGRIGNLTLFSGPVNIEVSNDPFKRKKPAYEGSSIKMTQELARMPQFKFNDIKTRSAKFAKVAVKLWPRP